MIGKTSPHAKRLRRDATDAERLLWQRLRGRQLAGHKIRRQATVGSYIVDFRCVEAKLVIEADGGQHSPVRDAERTAGLESRGLRVARFWNNDIVQNVDGVLQAILLLLEDREEKEPSPNPLP
jgi:adenine-specific DNA-methyltransferase